MKFVRIAVVALFTLLVGAYVNLLGPQIQQKAANFQKITGADFDIVANDNGSCPDGANNTNTSYGGQFILTNKHNSPQDVHVIIHRFFCPGTVQNCQPNSNDSIEDKGTVHFDANQTLPITVDSYSGNTACGVPGTYQADIEMGGFSPKFQSAMWCYSTPVCQATPTNTPVPPTATATPTQPACNVYCNRTVDQNGCYQVKSHNSCSCDTVCHPTATATPTNQPTATPTGSVSNNCDNVAINGNTNANVNCNNQNQSQGQSQGQAQGQSQETHVNVNNTNNNNNTVNNNISFASWAPQQQQQQQQQIQVAPAPSAKSLPNTGTPLGAWAVISGLPVGLIIKRFTKWS